jgi:hypothetical protein
MHNLGLMEKSHMSMWNLCCFCNRIPKPYWIKLIFLSCWNMNNNFIALRWVETWFWVKFIINLELIDVS